MDSLHNQLEHTLSRFVFYCNLQDERFVPEEISAAGEALSRKLNSMRNEWKHKLIFPVSPNYRVSHNMADIRCQLYIYDFARKHNCTLHIGTLRLCCRQVEMQMVIDDADYLEIQEMRPWRAEAYLKTELLWSNCLRKNGSHWDMNGNGLDDSIHIRNLQNRFFHQCPDQTGRFWANSEEDECCIDFLMEEPVRGSCHIERLFIEWQQEAINNQGFYKYITLTGVPLIQIDGDVAESFCFVQAFVPDHQKERHMAAIWRYLCLLHVRYIRQNNQWKLQKLETQTLAKISDPLYISQERYEKMTGESGRQDFLAAGDMIRDLETYREANTKNGYSQSIEDIHAIENLLSEWTTCCREGRLMEYYDENMRNSEAVSRMLIRSQGNASDELVGESQIIDKLSGMDRLFRGDIYSFHTATTPYIALSPDGRQAIGMWYDHSATNLYDSEKNEQEIPYMIFVAKYIHRFLKIGNRWYHHQFYWEPLIHMSEWYSDYQPFETTRIIKTVDSPTGYMACIRLKAPEYAQLHVIGDWMFSDQYSSSRLASAKRWPHQWNRSCFPHMLLGLKNTPDELLNAESGENIKPKTFDFDWDILKLGIYELKKDVESGLFSIDIPLPSGIYNYRFITDMAGGNPLKMQTMPDPNNRPVMAKGEHSTQSQLHMPYCRFQQTEDRSIEIPYEGIECGKICFISYPAFSADESEQQAGVYLPYNYDKKRIRPYPVLYLSHGGSGNASVWFNEGGASHILDHLISEGKCDPMIVVTMNNERHKWRNKAACIPNLMNNLIPYIESHYNVGRSPDDRAFAGFSAGGFLAFDLYTAYPEAFYSIGIWSAGQRGDCDFTRPELKSPNLHIGGGRYDDAFYSFGYQLEDTLSCHNIAFTSYFPEGGHQWSVWRKLFEDYISRCLWPFRIKKIFDES